MSIVQSLTRTFLSAPLVSTLVAFICRFFSVTKKAVTNPRMDENLRVRTNPVVTKLDTPHFHSMFTTDLKDLLKLFEKHKFEVRVAGGAVRDILMNMNPTDIDIATTATPTQMKEMFLAENIRLINMNGEKHGTITPRINDNTNYEVTTLRIDIRTDGRHAEVEFTKDWLLDANRRDLTINSMFLGFDGTLYDYFYGYEDLEKRRIAFVGHADKRIKEDYLRILRYFRFYGRIAEHANNHDKVTLQTISQNAMGLKQISGERIWTELRKILLGNFACELICDMIGCELGKYIGLPEKVDTSEFKRLCQVNAKFEDKCNAITLLTALLRSPEDAVKMHERLKLSAFERDLAYYIAQNREVSKNFNTLKDFQIMHFAVPKSSLAHEYLKELLKYHGNLQLYESYKVWKAPTFPIKATDLAELNVQQGPQTGFVLNKLKKIWIDRDYELQLNEISKHIPDILKEWDQVAGDYVKHSTKKRKLSK